jgi:hypothetical protein
MLNAKALFVTLDTLRYDVAARPYAEPSGGVAGGRATGEVS